MSRTSDAIDAAGAIVREALIAPNVHATRATAAERFADRVDSGERLRRVPVSAAHPDGLDAEAVNVTTPVVSAELAGVVEIQMTVKLSDVLGELSPIEAKQLAAGRLSVRLAAGFTDDAGNLLDYTGHPAYAEAQSMVRTTAPRQMQEFLQRQLRNTEGLHTIDPNVWRPGEQDAPV